MSHRTPDSEKFYLLSQGRKAQKLATDNGLQPLLDHIYENRVKVAERLLKYLNDHAGSAIWNRRENLYQHLKKLKDGNEFLDYIVVHDMNMEHDLCPHKDLPLYIDHEESSRRDNFIIDYRLEIGI